MPSQTPFRHQRLTSSAHRSVAAALAIALASTAAAAEPALEVLEPKAATAVAPRTPKPGSWTWNQPQAEITPTGDLAWKPRPFAYQPGKSVKHIDFAQGSDDAAGTRQAPWKHHPWDPAATGAAKAATGIHTYVFKRGVVYRGSLVARESGVAGDPIRLTSDPTWGEGEAVIAGSDVVGGWKQGAAHPDIPDAAKVWHADIDWLPRAVWEVRDGTIERIPLARTPNWKVSDPEDVTKEWFEWQQPEWWKGDYKISHNGHKALRGIDAKNLTQPAEYYQDAILRTEYSIIMGTPYPTRVEGFDAQRKALIFQGMWFGDSTDLRTGNRYMLEDKPHYLDVGGEFWFERKGAGGRLHLRLPGDRDPNTTVIEAGNRINLIEDGASADAPPRLDTLTPQQRDAVSMAGIAHVEISGLGFRGTNTHWDMTLQAWGHKEVDNACIRLRGATDALRIAGCRFVHANQAVAIDPIIAACKNGGIVVEDNDIDHMDHAAIRVDGGGTGDIAVRRNRLAMIGLRAFRNSHGHALQVNFPETMDVAGNILTRCYGAGVFVWGGKRENDGREVVLSRQIIRQNRVVDSLLNANDWGGIETWQGGPFYLYGNISGNPNGTWMGRTGGKPGSARLGFAYYHDGGFKNYDFNNVAWGLSADPLSPHCNHAAFYEAVSTTENLIFNNTVYRFFVGTQWSPAGGKHFFLGNLWIDTPGYAFQHGKLKEDKGEPPPAYPHHSMAYGRNLFGGVLPKTFAVFESAGKAHDLASMRAALESHGALATDVGTTTDKPIVRDAEKHDFRPVPGSPAIDHGVKVFVPWGLSKVVGEWHFRRDRSDPTRVHDNHWHMPAYMRDRDIYHRAPVFDLVAPSATAASFVAGPLEDWTEGAFSLDGVSSHLIAPHSAMIREFKYKVGKEDKTASGSEIASPDIGAGNLLIEAYVQAKAGQGASVLVAKRAAAGYQLALNRAGGVTLTLLAGGTKAELASGARIADGKWHHVLVEVDRAAGTGAIYVDGVASARGAMALPADASLANEADLLVGKGPDGHHFTGAIEFLRIARGTLAEARTSIEELYDWQFDGPFLRDFAGKPITGKTRDAGAFEAEGR